MATSNTSKLPGFLSKLHQIQIGGSSADSIKKQDLIQILRNLETMFSNGVAIPQALDTICKERAFAKYRHILRSLSDAVKSGGSLSSGMRRFPSVFPQLTLHQVKIGEQSGNLQQTLKQIVGQLEEGSKIRSFIMKKMTYPMLLVVAGVGSVTFMLTSVIPTFQKMYEENGAVLPWITQFLIDTSEFLQANGMAIGITLLVSIVAGIAAYKNKSSRLFIDEWLLRMPLIGKWFRNLAILQFMETLSNLLDSGFKLVEALPPASKAVGNQHLRAKLLNLHSAIRRGEKFSAAMQREQDLFPPVVHQLVVVGERTGQLSGITCRIRDHLREDVQKSTSVMLGTIEPILTSGLAVAVGGILLAVYLPMFDMIGNANR
ncbi:MAG: type II secretion system F family protein [Aureliella sp.]